MLIGELQTYTMGELAAVSLGELGTSTSAMPEVPDNMRRFYSPDRDDPKSRHVSFRDPMDRRVIRYGARCDVCETLNYWTHGEAHASGGEIACTTCGTLLRKDDVLWATKGRQNPLNPR